MTPARAVEITAFLRRQGWGDAERRPLAGDASARRYERLYHSGGTAILMDAPPAENAPATASFLHIATWLREHGFSAPEILASNEPAGLLLLEDLGEGLFSRQTDRAPDRAEMLYSAGIETIVGWQILPPPGDLPTPDATALAEATALAWKCYGFGGGADAVAELARCLAETEATAPVLALRDVHAENLIWLPEREGIARVGLLDFQDAFLAHPAYDVVSLTQDARRDVPPGLQERLLAQFLSLTGYDPEIFRRDAAAIAAQRHLRILGVFARLAGQGRPHYLTHVPRVWRQLLHNLKTPHLATLRAAVLDTLPEPAAGHLDRLRTRAGHA